MQNHERLDLYKELYFSEERAREGIQARLQFVLALIVPVVAGAGYLLDKSRSMSEASDAVVAIQIACAILALAATASIVYFVRATWGHSYQAIPHASRMETYRLEIWETYKDYEEQEGLTDYYFKAFLCNAFAEAASFNTTVNEHRAELIHKCVTFLVVAIVPLLIAFFIFLSADYAIVEEPEVRHERKEPATTTATTAPSAQIRKEGRPAETATTSSPKEEVDDSGVNP